MTSPAYVPLLVDPPILLYSFPANAAGQDKVIHRGSGAHVSPLRAPGLTEQSFGGSIGKLVRLKSRGRRGRGSYAGKQGEGLDLLSNNRDDL